MDSIIFLDESVTVRWYHKTRAHYEALGYKYTKYLGKFRVKPQHLTRGSHVRVLVQCPECKESRRVVFKDVLGSGTSICKRCSDINDLSGQRFGKLTVVRVTKRRSGKNVVWLCRCDCGREVYRSGGRLTSDVDSRCNIGPCNVRWNGSLSREERVYHRASKRYIGWREAVFERDRYTCVFCNDGTGGNLVAHHLNSWDSHKRQRFDVSNGVTLCGACHKCFHDTYGYGENTHDQFNEWIRTCQPV